MSIFYKITARNGKVSYLFGTMHINEDFFITLPLEVKNAFEEATTCVFKTNIDNDIDINIRLAQRWIASQEVYLRTISLKDSFDAKIIMEQAHKTLADWVKLKELEKPTFNDDTNILDFQLENEAYFKNKKVAYLELLEDSLTALYGYHLNILEQIELTRFIESEQAQGKKFPRKEDLIAAYQQQDIQKLSDLVQVYSQTKTVPDPVRRYFDTLAINRDLNMAVGMKRYLEQGKAFVAVGVGHLKGIIEKLQSKGYTIEPISLGKRYYPIDGTVENGEQVAAFRKIYTALYAAQSNFFKKRVFIPTDDEVVSFKSIQEHASYQTRSHTAWALAEKHYKNISSTNCQLVKNICQAAYAHSGSIFGLFKRTKTNLDNASSIAEASAESRTGVVRDILDGAPI